MMITSTIKRGDKPTYRKYYATGNDLMRLNMELIIKINKYALSQNDPEVIEIITDVTKFITTAKAAEDILKYVMYYEGMTEELSNFLIKAITEVYN